VTALFDTSVLVDHLMGRPEAADVLTRHGRGAISVISWVEIMGAAPAGFEEATRAFLHRFERLAINEAIADRAVSLRRLHPALTLSRALIYATAIINILTFVSVDVPASLESEPNVLVPYRRAALSTQHPAS
jgi:predicted nucleic acid-binding protein